MRRTAARLSVWTAVAFVLALSLASGPLVGGVDFTGEPREGLTTRGASVVATVESVPTDDVRLTRGRFGTDVYYLRVPDAVLDVRAAHGRSIAVYKVTVPALDFERIATKTVSPGVRGERRLEMPPRAFLPGTITRDAYEGTIVIRANTNASRGDGPEIVYRSNVTIEVA